MNKDRFAESLSGDAPEASWPAPLASLWWDAKGNWAKAHALVDELETPEGMAVHAYLHRKEGATGNAEYWYRRSGQTHRRAELLDERDALLEALAPGTDGGEPRE